MPAARRQHAGERHQQGRLPGAVGADDRAQGALLEGDRDLVQHLDVAVSRAQRVDGEQGAGRRRGGGAHARAPAPVPRYASTTTGSRPTSLGVPRAIVWPKLRTTTESQAARTSGMSCSIRSTAIPPAAIARIVSTSRVVSDGFIPAAGSSSISTAGEPASARAI